MKCGFCGKEFDEELAERGCKNCSLIENCGLVKCPNCGYEMPPTPQLLKNILKWRKIDDKAK